MAELIWQMLFALWPLWLFCAVMFVLAVVITVYRERRLLRSGIRDIDRMSGTQFEQFLRAFFERKGFRAELPPTYDRGADLILTKGGERTAVQAKRWRGPVHVDAVRAVVASKDSYHCTKAMVVTNSVFTRPALEQARDSRVELWDRQRLTTELLAMKGTVSPRGMPTEVHHSDPTPDNSSSLATCAVCGIRVSDRVRDYYISHAGRFGGRVLCMKHQRQTR